MENIWGISDLNRLLLNNSISKVNIKKNWGCKKILFISKNNLFEKMDFIFNTGDMNYIFTHNGIKYIYNEDLFVNYIKLNTHYRPYPLFVKFNYFTENEKMNSLNGISLSINNNLLEDPQIDTIIRNIISWQVGMYEEDNNKNNIIDINGFWKADINNFFVPYTTQTIDFNTRGTLQEGVGIFIKLIIKYYYKYKNTELTNDCIKSIDLFIDFLNILPYYNGGVPLYRPLTGEYHDNITLNDCAMINYLRCCDFILKSNIKNKFNDDKILLLENNYKKSLDCLLNLQVTINNKKTIWPQQADPITLDPAKGRSFEVESLCSLESVQVLIYLMKKHPTQKIKDAIISGCEWFKTHSISGYKQYIYNDNITVSKTNDNVSLLWSRYYTLDTEEPVFFDRDVLYIL